MKFVPENLTLDLNREEVKIIVEYLQIDMKMNENLIKKCIKYGNKINNEVEK